MWNSCKNLPKKFVEISEYWMDECDFWRKHAMIWTICMIPLKEEIAPSIFNNFLTLEKRLVIFPHLKYFASSSFSSLSDIVKTDKALDKSQPNAFCITIILTPWEIWKRQTRARAKTTFIVDSGNIFEKTLYAFRRALLEDYRMFNLEVLNWTSYTAWYIFWF